MDQKLYEDLRNKVIERLDLDKSRAEDMLEFADAFANHVNSAAHRPWIACYLGVMVDGEFAIAKPKVESRMSMPFALKIIFSDYNADLRHEFGVHVPFHLSWSGQSDFRLSSLHDGSVVSFTSGQITNEGVLEKASALLDARLEYVVKEFVGQ